MRTKISIILLLFAMVFAMPCYAFTGAPIDDANCQAAWLMEADVDPIIDSSQNSNTGAEQSDPTHATADPPAAYSVGYEILDVVLDSFDVTMNPGGSLDPGGDFSIVAWIYLNSYGDNNFGRILDNLDTSGADVGWSWYVNNNGGINTMSLNIADGVVETETGNTGTLSTGSWIHVGVVFDDTANTVDWYVNGVAGATDTAGKTPSASGINPTIGDRNDNLRQFDGRLDEVAFFDRTISEAEVNDIMNNGLSPSGAPAVNNSQVIIINQW